jgi:4-hydroxy 2-oxovalerate aldolase
LQMTGESNKKPKILDCTLRDGGYVNNWEFDKELAREAYRCLSKSGVDVVEMGFRSSTKHFDPHEYGPWRFSSEEDLAEVTENIRGAKICVMGDFGKIDLEDLTDAKDSSADMVRIAAHKDNIRGALELLERIKEKGYEISFQCMGYSTYTEAEQEELMGLLKKSSIDYFYVADSYGSLFPSQIKAIFEPFLEMARFKVGFHPHNGIQMAFANTLEAMRVGVDIVDCSIYGVGRGAGNLPTEILLSYLVSEGSDRYNVIPVLNCVERYFLDLMKQTPWGYQLPFMISGIFNSHPDYAKDMLRRREHSMEEIWRVMAYVKAMRPIGFDRTVVENLIRKGVIGNENGKRDEPKAKGTAASVPSLPTQTVPYVKRHENRDFLVLANGPSLKQCKEQIDGFIEKYDPIVLGANYLGGLFEPDYHAFSNQKRVVSYAGTVSEKSKLLIGTNIPEEVIEDYVNRPYEPLVFHDVLDADFDVRDGIIMTNCRTVSVLLAGVAVVMGANRVHIAGMDGYLQQEAVRSALTQNGRAGEGEPEQEDEEGTLFYEEKFDATAYDLNVERHRWNDKFLRQIDEYVKKQGGEGVHILTPTSHEAFYKSIAHYIDR